MNFVDNSIPADTPAADPVHVNDWFWTFMIPTFLAIACYLLGQLKKDNSYVDVFWAQFFVWCNYTALYLNNNWTYRTILVSSMVAVWGFRLSIHILVRHKGEDYRYVTLFRKRHERCHPKWGPIIIPIFHIYLMQLVFSMLNNLSALWIVQYDEGSDLNWIDYVGSAIWLTGVLFEIIGDAQLSAWLNTPGNVGSGKVITSGLWRYTRHPNYFGEAFLWWGIYVISLNVDGGWKTFASALFITLLIRYVSGVAMLERKQKKKVSFRRYMKETNAFVTWFHH
jgi:steroid 5-alpha reductase family enzyme